MKPVICKHTKETKRGEVTEITVFGVPVFRGVYVGSEDTARRAVGFTALASDAPVEVSDYDDADDDDDDDADDDDEQFIILPYGKDKQRK